MTSARLAHIQSHAFGVPLSFDADVPITSLHRPITGWSHFAQFTIAVVNKDPKKSKYSGIQLLPPSSGISIKDDGFVLAVNLFVLFVDTLHRFCKKEHDWGWKKFMELSKVLDGFTVADTLVIKAQVQVIKYVCLCIVSARVLLLSLRGRRGGCHLTGQQPTIKRTRK